MRGPPLSFGKCASLLPGTKMSLRTEASFDLGTVVQVKYEGAWYDAEVTRIFKNGAYDVYFPGDASKMKISADLVSGTMRKKRPVKSVAKTAKREHDSEDDRFRCGLCMEFLVDNVESSCCSTLFCRACVEVAFYAEGSGSCPNCHFEDFDEPFDVLPQCWQSSRWIQKQVDEIRAKKIVGIGKQKRRKLEDHPRLKDAMEEDEEEEQEAQVKFNSTQFQKSKNSALFVLDDKLDKSVQLVDSNNDCTDHLPNPPPVQKRSKSKERRNNFGREITNNLDVSTAQHCSKVRGKQKGRKKSGEIRPVQSSSLSSTSSAAIPASIDDVDSGDATDALMVVDYVKDIYENMRSKEVNCVSSTYMQHQVHITPKMRAILVDWLVGIANRFRCEHETIYLTVNIVDRYLEIKNTLTRDKLQLVGVVALLVSILPIKYFL